MKRLILSGLVCLFSFNILIAQEADTKLARTLILGGSFGFGSSENGADPFISSRVINGVLIREPAERESSFFSLAPYLGSQVSDHWILGGRGLFSISSNTFGGVGVFNPVTGQFTGTEQKTTGTSVGIAAFGRYTVNPEQKVGLYIQSEIGYELNSNKQEVDGMETGKSKSNFVELSVRPGINWKLSDKFSLLATLGQIAYQNGKWEDELSDLSQDFSSILANFNLAAFQFGVEFRL